MSKHTVALLRVSGDKQTDDSQHQPILDEIARRGLEPGELATYQKHREAYDRKEGICIVGRDVGTGRNDKREAYQFAYNEMNAGRINTIICWRFDRLHRNAANCLAMLKRCKEKEVELFSCMEKIPFDSAAGNMMFGMLALAAEFQSSTISEATRAGLRAAKAKAMKEGRPWKCGGTNKGVLRDKVVKVVPRFLEMNEAKHTIRHMSKILGLTTRTIVRLKKRVPELEEKYGHKKYRRKDAS